MRQPCNACRNIDVDPAGIASWLCTPCRSGSTPPSSRSDCGALAPRLSPSRGSGLVRIPRPWVTDPTLASDSASWPCPAISGGPANSCGFDCPLFSRKPPPCRIRNSSTVSALQPSHSRNHSTFNVQSHGPHHHPLLQTSKGVAAWSKVAAEDRIAPGGRVPRASIGSASGHGPTIHSNPLGSP